MKKDKNSSVSIKQLLATTLVVGIITLGGLNAFRIVSTKSENTILEFESAENTEKSNFEAALVENTEDDVIYSENIKFLAANTIEDSLESENNENTEDIIKNALNSYAGKIVSRGNYLKRQISGTTENGNLLNTLLTGIKDLSEKQENIVEKFMNSNLKAEIVKEGLTDVANNEGITVENTNPENVVDAQNEEEQKQDENIEPQGAPTEYVKTIDVKATAYCLCTKCCGKSPSHPEYGVTASGLKIIPGTGMKVVASDPKVIPLGTKVYVEGLNGVEDYGYAIVADTGSAIKNLKIDLYMETHEMASSWGIRNVRVYILDN